MAKLSFELEIDWLDEEQSLDDAIREGIENRVISKVEQRFMEKVAERFEQPLARLEATIDQRVNEIAMKVIDNFVENQKFPRFKNSYDKNPEYKSITEILGEKLEAALMQSVDKEGSPVSGSYSRVGTRLDWLTGKIAEKLVDERVKEVTKNIKAQIENFILQKVKGEIFGQLSTEILKNVDFEKLTSGGK